MKAPLRDLNIAHLEKDPAKRTGARGIKGHPFLRGVDWDRILCVTSLPYISDPSQDDGDEYGCEVLDVEKVVHERSRQGR